MILFLMILYCNCTLTRRVFGASGGGGGWLLLLVPVNSHCLQQPYSGGISFEVFAFATNCIDHNDIAAIMSIMSISQLEHSHLTRKYVCMYITVLHLNSLFALIGNGYS